MVKLNTMDESTIQFEPLHAQFGARVCGLDLSAPITPGVAKILADALDEYSLLHIPNQPITDEIHLALTRALGEPEPNHLILGATGEIEYFGTIGNVVDEKTHKGNDDAQTVYLSGNYMWHSDSSFRDVPSKFSINHAHEVPGEGGETLFVSERTAYERLSDTKKHEIDPLIVIHDYLFSRSQVSKVNPNHAAQFPAVEHKLVRTNPNNGRKNFYIGSHARTIAGYGGVQARQLLDDLLEASTRDEDIYVHQWQVGDTVIWDNRSTLHRGSGYDADRWRRLMRQTRVAGAGPTLNEN